MCNPNSLPKILTSFSCIRSNLNDAINFCNSDSKCDCVETNSSTYYAAYRSGDVLPRSTFNVYVITAI